MGNTALLVVDVQTALINFHPYKETEVLANIVKLIETARQNGMEVIFVRHDGGVGTPLAYGTEGWQIFSEVSPIDGEKIFDKKFSSSFRDTGLRNYLDGKGITDFILVGMQTDYCIDTTCRIAFEFGYNVVIPACATTTFDNSLATAEKLIEYFEQKLWDKRFAEVLPIEKVIGKITSSGK